MSQGPPPPSPRSVPSKQLATQHCAAAHNPPTLPPQHRDHAFEMCTRFVGGGFHEGKEIDCKNGEGFAEVVLGHLIG